MAHRYCVGLLVGALAQTAPYPYLPTLMQAGGGTGGGTGSQGGTGATPAPGTPAPGTPSPGTPTSPGAGGPGGGGTGTQGTSPGSGGGR